MEQLFSAKIIIDKSWCRSDTLGVFNNSYSHVTIEQLIAYFSIKNNRPFQVRLFNPKFFLRPTLSEGFRESFLVLIIF